MTLAAHAGHRGLRFGTACMDCLIGGAVTMPCHAAWCVCTEAGGLLLLRRSGCAPKADSWVLKVV